jgi:MFS family permease
LIIIACFLLTAVSIGITVNCFGVLAPELEKEYNATKSAVQYVFMIAALANLIGSAVVGKIMGKFTMRLAMPVYAIIFSA